MVEKKTAKKPKSKTTSKTKAKTSKTKSKAKSTQSKSKKAKVEPFNDGGIIVVDDDIEVDQDKINEERRAYLEEARSQETSD